MFKEFSNLHQIKKCDVNRSVGLPGNRANQLYKNSDKRKSTSIN